jgi:hypothetical protein
MNAALSFICYGAVVGAALWLAWQDEDYCSVAWTLVGSFVVSNLVWHLADPESRPGVYSMLELFVIVMTFMAWAHKRGKGLVLLVAVSAGSIAANIAFASIRRPELSQIHLHEAVINICFLTECLIVGVLGGLESARAGRFNWLPSGGGRHPEPDAAVERES